MPFPVSFRGAFDYPAIGEQPAPGLVTDRIERALRQLGARELVRDGSSLAFVGPSAWTAARLNPLMILRRGEVDIVGPAADGAPAQVRYAFRTTKGLGVLVAIATAIEVYVRILDGPQLPALVFPSVLAFAWSVNYVVAWVRVPLLLMRAADGELESRGTDARGAHRDPAT